jgi:small-conductance mechanosensitive channel
MQFDERINLEIMERFAEADIKLALPSIKNYLSREDDQSVKDLG